MLTLVDIIGLVGLVQLYPFSLENQGIFFLLQIGPASIRTRWNRPPKTQLFKTALQSRIFCLLKLARASFSACSVDGWKRKFTVSGLIAFVKKVNNERRITLSTGYITIIHENDSKTHLVDENFLKRREKISVHNKNEKTCGRSLIFLTLVPRSPTRDRVRSGYEILVSEISFVLSYGIWREREIWTKDEVEHSIHVDPPYILKSRRIF